MLATARVAEIEAQLESLEARGAELESRLVAGTATAAERAELQRVQIEAEFFFGLLEDMGAFDSTGQ
jgi:hypothetical protein